MAAVWLLAGLLLLVGQGSTVAGRTLGILLLVGMAAVIWNNARGTPRVCRLWRAHATYPATWKEVASQLRGREARPS